VARRLLGRACRSVATVTSIPPKEWKAGGREIFSENGIGRRHEGGATAHARYRGMLLGLHFEGLGPCDRHPIPEARGDAQELTWSADDRASRASGHR
jgi:hypothetical protein